MWIDICYSNDENFFAEKGLRWKQTFAGTGGDMDGFVFPCVQLCSHYQNTVKPVFFACPSFRDPDEFAKITGRKYIF